jgi:TonB family protein
MRLTRPALLLLLIVSGCSKHAQQPLCPKHIELPFYPPLAAVAHITGTVTLTLTIDADGRVADVKAETAGSRIFESTTIANARRWTFAKPVSSPVKQALVYDYKIDDSVPMDGPTKVTLDLPRVTIVASARSVQTDSSAKKD